MPDSGFVSTTITKATSGAAAQQPADGCAIPITFGYPGTAKCGSEAPTYKWSDDRLEQFALGTDGKVYHQWERSKGDTQGSNSYVLGSSNNVVDGVHPYGVPATDRPVVWVTGGDGRTYCDGWNGSAWTNWTLC